MRTRTVVHFIGALKLVFAKSRFVRRAVHINDHKVTYYMDFM